MQQWYGTKGSSNERFLIFHQRFERASIFKLSSAPCLQDDAYTSWCECGCETIKHAKWWQACAWMYTHIPDDALDRCMKRVYVCVCLCVCVYKLPVFFSQLCSYTDLWFCVWGVNSRVPVLSLKITLGLKFLAPFSSLLTGTLLTSLYACFSFPFLLFWNSLYPWSLFFLFFFLSVILNPSVATEKCLKLPRDR